ncbi:Integrin alpha N-terminal [Glarea lozoyensis ATCC 20868]|uniref:Integrin alpha N-terminal n=1 Tax=Glarea lozoyensis (strain ATCC 20868 / MF5171) TaxID=1116229 RepID=S3DBZ0_GLAL2|nr:Integrin alpha N-terminal [Glarea lozoyensis ATCC 20868]EPE24178.1 Integrin alpha N-terminal [Glarea lozoyensis ATCC 20868]
MGLLMKNLGALLAISSSINSIVPIAAQGLDYPTTNTGPSDATVDKAWNGYYPPYEGFTVTPQHQEIYDNVTDPAPDLRRREAKDFYLRVMPLGASIVEGIASSDSNGFRKHLRQQLRWKGWKVNMVGSKQNGNMADRDNEGHPGWVTSEIHGAWTANKEMKPNVVLLNAGTNDCMQNLDTNNVGTRVKAIVNDIFNSIDDVTVIVSTLVQSRNQQECAEKVSKQIREFVKSSEFSGKKIALADMFQAMNREAHLSGDGIHPNDAGYKLFAAVWWDAFQRVESRVSPPKYVASIDDSKTGSARSCTKVPGNARGPILTQSGSGHDDGAYVHQRKEWAADISARIEKKDDIAVIVNGIPDRMFFANLVVADPNADRAKTLDDWIRIYHDRDDKNTYYYRQNLGGGKFGASTTFNVDMDCNLGPKYAFADFNNDGYDDFFCLKSGSAVHVSINQKTNPPTFKYLGQVVPTHAGYTDLDVRIADIDGDGRADYCLVENGNVAGDGNGFIKCSRNAGQGIDYSWQGFKTAGGIGERVFDKVATADRSGVILGDLNGDNRADYMFIGNNGNVNTWTNMRGWGPGIVPEWNDAGITHQGQGDQNIRRNIKFGRIFGSGKLDYIYIKEEKEWYDVHVWENLGAGATRRKADGNYYCDMRGTGRDDYVWIYSHGGSAEIFANIQSPPEWGHDVTIKLSVPGPRNGIHLADWDGDGRCDVLVQNKATGAITPYINKWDANSKTITFVASAPTRATCNTGWGVNIFDKGMALADIDGDKRADILCLETSGRITGFLNKAGKLEDVGQIKKSEGWDRANLRFADVESKGKTDIIWLDKYTGAGSVWTNGGRTGNPAGNLGSSWLWTSRGKLYSPINRGECMMFSNQGGLGRADLLEVLPLSNRAWTYFNECGGGSGGDDGGSIADPNLPPYNSPEEAKPPTDYGDINKCTGTYYHLSDIPRNDLMICKLYYILAIWERVLSEKTTQFNNLIRDDYDRKFGIYANYIVDYLADNIKERLAEHGADYFECDVFEQIVCCRNCEAIYPGQCRHCAVLTTNEDLCKYEGTQPPTTPKYRYEPKKEDCPPIYNLRGIGGNDKQSVTWYLRSGDAERFYADIGVESKYIKFDDYKFADGSISDQYNCAQSPDSVHCKNRFMYYQYPGRTSDYTADLIKKDQNPKTFLSDSMKGIEGTLTELREIIKAVKEKRTIGSEEEPLDIRHLAWALYPSVTMVDESVNQMQKVLETAEKVEAEERKKVALAFLDTIFLVMPLVSAPLKATSSALVRSLGRTIGGFTDAYAVGRGLYDAATTSVPSGLLAIAGFAIGKAIARAPEAATISKAAFALDGAGLGPLGTPILVTRKALEELAPLPQDEIDP